MYRHKDKTDLFFVSLIMTMLSWCNVTSVSQALHFYVKAAVPFNRQTNTNLLFKLDCLFSFLRELKKARVKK